MMAYVLSFLEGIITFISPCLLPMLPLYLSFFAGGEPDPTHKRTLQGALGFISGFTLVFLLLGAFAGTLGSFLRTHQTAVNLVTGGIVVLFGLNYLGILRIGILNRVHQHEQLSEKPGFFSAMLFGIVFSIGWTPCVGAFLGSALLLASQQGSMLGGMGMLFAYSLGLGIPFLLAALLIEQLESAMQAIQSHYGMINKIAGSLLLLLGILMMTGMMTKIFDLFA